MNEDEVTVDEAPPTKHTYTNPTFGELVKLHPDGAEFRAEPGADTVLISLDMVRAVAEALVLSGAVQGQRIVDSVHLSTRVPKPVIPKISVKSSIEFILTDIKKAGTPDAIFIRGGERMRDITAAIMEITRETSTEVE